MKLLNIRKITGRLLALSLLMASTALPALAESVEVDGMVFEINSSDNTASLTSTTSDLAIDVVIPESVLYNGLPVKVTKIGDGSFRGNTQMQSLSIPGTVLEVGTFFSKDYGSNNMPASAPSYNLPFQDCRSLKNVRFEDGTEPLKLGYYYIHYKSNNNYYTFSHNLFEDCPLEEIYIGRDFDENSVNLAFHKQNQLVRVTFGTKCIQIADAIFQGNSSISIINLPDNIQGIGERAFENCNKLTTLNLGVGLTTIKDYAFHNCSNLTKLTLPDNITEIGAYAFQDCTSITEITVGNNLKSVGACAFAGCTSFTAIILPDGFTTMGESAFSNCKKLTIAKLGKSLEAVPSGAFSECTSLSEMFIPASVTSIGDRAFYNDSGIASLTMEEGVRTIGSEVFYNNSGLVRIEIPGTVISIGERSFLGCSNLVYLTFRQGDELLEISSRYCRPDQSSSNKYIEDYNYFVDSPIRFLTIGRNIVYDYRLKTSYHTGGAGSLFYNKSSIVSVTIKPNVTFLYHYLLAGCSGIKQLVLPDGLQQVYSYALSSCTSLTSLVFPEPLVLLDESALAYDTNLTNVQFKEEPGNSLEFTIGESAMYGCKNITSLEFPSKTISIGNLCFHDCSGLKQLTFIDSKNSIYLGYDKSGNSNIPLFYYSNLESLYMGRNIYYDDRLTPILDTLKISTYAPFSNQKYLTDVKFSQNGTVTFCINALLYGVNNCEELTLPESLKTIGDYTFADMTILKDITIPNAVTEIGKYAFAFDTNLKYARLSNSCPWLKEGLFSDCESLAEITIPQVVTKMDDFMFRNCTSLASATFEGSKEVITMGFGANDAEHGLFRDCPLETLNLDRWLSYNTDKPERAPFCHIAELKNLNIGENVGVIDKYMFSYCTGLEELYLPDNITSVGLWGFRGCSSLKSIRFSQKLSQVSDYGFSECSSLDNVVFPSSMTSVADNSFSNCTSLKKLDLGNSLNIIGPSAFENDSALEGIVIPETLYGLGVRSFANCTSLPYVAIRAITSVGKEAFQGCTGLKWVSLSEKTTSLGEDSFADCPGIGYIKSYAEFPPEGLVNFVESVPANGTLFVPESSIDYYAYSPTWENWKDIRPLNDNILSTSIAIDLSTANAKAGKTVQLTATVGADDATDKSVIWRSSNEEVATVDETGLITAVSVGEAIVAAMCADGSGLKAECVFTVDPTLVESINITNAPSELKKGRSVALTAVIAPSDATSQEMKWSSSNIGVVRVDNDGNITAVATGSATITATANDGSGISKDFVVTVIPTTKGDANDNDEVTITDAVHTANYAVGIEVENFNREGADINGDNRITLADATGIVAIALEQPVAQTLAAKASRAPMSMEDVDHLVIDTSLNTGDNRRNVSLRLVNRTDYVAMQADIVLPAGMTLKNISQGSGASYHALSTYRISENVTRVALFNPGNEVFGQDEVLLELEITADKTATGTISVENIRMADASAVEYILYSTSDNSGETSGIENISDSSINIYTASEGIVIDNALNQPVIIYRTDGKIVFSAAAEENHVVYNAAKGAYIVTAGDKTVKVIR